MNKKLMITISIVVVMIISIAGIAIGLNSKNSGLNGGSDTSGYSSIDTEVLFGDYSAMFNLSKDIQNGYATGKVVRVDGVVSHPGTLYSITESTEDGSKNVGTEFVIEGGNVSYPEDGARVVITGEVVEKSTLYFVIKTKPEFVEIKD